MQRKEISIFYIQSSTKQARITLIISWFGINLKVGSVSPRLAEVKREQFSRILNLNLLLKAQANNESSLLKRTLILTE